MCVILYLLLALIFFFFCALRRVCLVITRELCTLDSCSDCVWTSASPSRAYPVFLFFFFIPPLSGFPLWTFFFVWRASSFTITTRSDKSFCVCGVPLRKWKVKQPQQQRHTHTHTKREKEGAGSFFKYYKVSVFFLDSVNCAGSGRFLLTWSFICACLCVRSIVYVCVFSGECQPVLAWLAALTTSFQSRASVCAAQNCASKGGSCSSDLLQVRVHRKLEQKHTHTHTQNNDNNNSKETRFFCPSLNRWKSLFSFLFFFFFFWGRL